MKAEKKKKRLDPDHPDFDSEEEYGREGNDNSSEESDQDEEEGESEMDDDELVSDDDEMQPKSKK